MSVDVKDMSNDIVMVVDLPDLHYINFRWLCTL